MSWTPIYIHGREGFELALQKHMAQSDFEHMAGASEEECLYMCWINERAPIRALKEAIGARLVFRYRLQFFLSIDDYRALDSCDETLTLAE